MSRHSNVRRPDFAHSVGRTSADTSMPSLSGPAASSTVVDVLMVTDTSASLSRSVRKWVATPERRRISMSCPSTQTALVRSIQSLSAPTTTRRGCGFSAELVSGTRTA